MAIRRARMLSEYNVANQEYKALIRYLQVAVGVLPKPECQLLLEFAEASKLKRARLRRALAHKAAPGKRRSAARSRSRIAAR